MQLDLFDKPLSHEDWVDLRLRNMEDQARRAQKAQFAKICEMQKMIINLVKRYEGKI